MPATAVRMILSLMICERMSVGVAPIARRMPISVVRSRTVTIIMLETPIAPASSVPMPTSHMRKFTPEKRLSSSPKSTSVLNTMTAFSSSGATLCALAMTSRMRCESSFIFVPGFAVAQIRSTLSPRLYVCCMSESATTLSSALPLMFMLPAA